MLDIDSLCREINRLGESVFASKWSSCSAEWLDDGSLWVAVEAYKPNAPHRSQIITKFEHDLFGMEGVNEQSIAHYIIKDTADKLRSAQSGPIALPN